MIVPGICVGVALVGFARHSMKAAQKAPKACLAVGDHVGERESGSRCLSLEVHEARMPPLPLEEALFSFFFFFFTPPKLFGSRTLVRYILSQTHTREEPIQEAY